MWSTVWEGGGSQSNSSLFIVRADLAEALEFRQACFVQAVNRFLSRQQRWFRHRQFHLRLAHPPSNQPTKNQGRDTTQLHQFVVQQRTSVSYGRRGIFRAEIFQTRRSPVSRGPTVRVYPLSFFGSSRGYGTGSLCPTSKAESEES